jgi:molybdenum-dependent DNA-binding transcriptional regulator ModE
MVLENATAKTIIEFVKRKPCTIDEIAKVLGKNWRTADRYVERIASESGELAVRTFRGGTRGALKIVYHVTRESIASTEFQERLLQRVLAGRRKEDFSPFDIYQYVEPKLRRAFMEAQDSENAHIDQGLTPLLRGAQKQVLIFSGNLSWANVKEGRTQMLDILEELALAGVQVKIITRVEVASLKNLARVQEVNERAGRDLIEIRHAEQPLRAVVIDDKVVRFKELLDPLRYKAGELDKHTYVFYEVHDKEWVEWLSRVFFSLFRAGVPASRRLDGLNSIQKTVSRQRR